MLLEIKVRMGRVTMFILTLSYCCTTSSSSVTFVLCLSSTSSVFLQYSDSILDESLMAFNCLSCVWDTKSENQLWQWLLHIPHSSLGFVSSSWSLVHLYCTARGITNVDSQPRCIDTWSGDGRLDEITNEHQYVTDKNFQSTTDFASDIHQTIWDGWREGSRILCS